MKQESVTQGPVERTEKVETQMVWRRLAALWRAEFCSPKDFVRRAMMITVIYLGANVAGLREFTTMLNGTMGSVELGWWVSACFGIAYVLIYLAFVLLVPMLLLAAAFLAAWKRIFVHKRFPKDVL